MPASVNEVMNENSYDSGNHCVNCNFLSEGKTVPSNVRHLRCYRVQTLASALLQALGLHFGYSTAQITPFPDWSWRMKVSFLICMQGKSVSFDY